MKRIAVIGLSGMSVFLGIDHFHNKGETVTANNIFEEAGGKGFNQAVAAKRLGCDVSFLSAVGNDQNGKMCRETLMKEKIDCVLAVKKDKTAYAAILTDKNGENKVTVFRGASLEENDVDIFEKHIAESDLLLLQLEVPAEVNVKAAETAKKYGVPYVLNPAPVTSYDTVIGELCRNAALITPNEVEAKVIFGTEGYDPDEIYQKFKKSGISTAVVTLGSRGSAVMTKDKMAIVGAEKVNAVDTTGAGDVYNAAFCDMLVNNIEKKDDIDHLTECARYASKAAAFSVCRNHVMDSIPFESDII